MAFLAAVSWGMNSHFAKLGMKSDNAYHGLFARAVISVPILLGIVLIWKGWAGITVYFHSPTIFMVIGSAFLIIIGDSLFLYSLSRYTVNLIVPITAIYPLFTSIILIITGTETVGIGIIFGTIIVIIGIILVSTGDLSGTFNLTAIGLGLGSAISWGTSVVLLRLVTDVEGTDGFGLTGVRMVIIGGVGYLMYLSQPKLRKKRAKYSDAERRKSRNYFFLSGLIGWVVGASLFTFSIQAIGAAVPTPISSTNPIIASLIGLWLGLETLSRKQFLGISLSVLGVIIIIL